MIETKCKRCGKPCRGGGGNPEARLLKRAEKGLCADCALTEFLKKTEPLSHILKEIGVELLREKHIKAQIANLLIVGHSDASIGEIDIERVIANWSLA